MFLHGIKLGKFLESDFDYSVENPIFIGIFNIESIGYGLKYSAISSIISIINTTIVDSNEYEGSEIPITIKLPYRFEAGFIQSLECEIRRTFNKGPYLFRVSVLDIRDGDLICVFNHSNRKYGVINITETRYGNNRIEMMWLVPHGFIGPSHEYFKNEAKYIVNRAIIGLNIPHQSFDHLKVIVPKRLEKQFELLNTALVSMNIGYDIELTEEETSDFIFINRITNQRCIIHNTHVKIQKERKRYKIRRLSE